MAFYSNSINFPNLTVKGTPTTSDIMPLADAAAGNIPKQATVGSLPFLQLAGGTMTGFLTLNADPVNALHAVTKQYADAIAAGFDVKTPAYAGTTANLNATYLNGIAGVGATLTNAGSLAAFSVDGVSPPINSRILVKNQTSTFQNGIYVLSTVGSGAVAWILTRATDYDQAPSEIFPGNFIIVNNGTTLADTAWIETATVTTIGTDPITFSQFGQSSIGVFFKQTEIDFGATPVNDATFSITDANVSATSRIVICLSGDTPTGKDNDELEFDTFSLIATPAAGSFSLYARALEGYVADKFKINYSYE